MEDYQQSLETEKIEEANKKQEREREISEQVSGRGSLIGSRIEAGL